ncbi:MAG TPA: ECF transporter S component [Firmicutes bacterium]|nr:ECF transporter S component [Bacillota bacterium]
MQNTRRKETFRLVLAAMFAAFGVLLPSVFHMFNMGGPIFLPMHIPVLLCGLVCGWKYGLLVGLIVPFLSSFTGMPVLYPTGVVMMLELATYGCVIGLVSQKQNTLLSLVTAMLCGRLVSGLANVVLLGVGNYGIQAFVTASFVTALPGIVIQLVLIPAVMLLLKRTHVMERLEG